MSLVDITQTFYDLQELNLNQFDFSWSVGRLAVSFYGVSTLIG